MGSGSQRPQPWAAARSGHRSRQPGRRRGAELRCRGTKSGRRRWWRRPETEHEDQQGRGRAEHGTQDAARCPGGDHDGGGVAPLALGGGCGRHRRGGRPVLDAGMVRAGMLRAGMLRAGMLCTGMLCAGAGFVGGHTAPHVVGLWAIATVGAEVEAKLKIQGCCPGGGKAGGGSTLDGTVTVGGEGGT
jgi:hypothetical protein